MVNNLLSIHAKSFRWAGFFLPSDVYKNGSDLYDFCRILDDIADEEISLEIKKKKFINYKTSATLRTAHSFQALIINFGKENKEKLM